MESWFPSQMDSGNWAVESTKATIQFAVEAIRAVILVNGGAAVAILAFLGNAASKSSSIQLDVVPISAALGHFAFGLAGGVACAAFSYLAQLCYLQNWDRSGRALHATAIISCLAGLVLFLVGVLTASAGFRP